MAVAQEGACLGGAPAGEILPGPAGDLRVAGSVVLETVCPAGVVERGRQGGDTPAQGHQASPGAELAADELGDVLMVKALEADRAERGDEIVVQVGVVAVDRVRFAGRRLGLEPVVQVFGDGLGVVDADACPLALQHVGQGS